MRRYTRRPAPSEVVGWRISRLSGGRARPGPGPHGRSSSASSPGLVLTASRGRRCGSPLGPAQGCSSVRAAPRGALSGPHREPGGRGPSRRPQLQPVFVASSRSTACWRLTAPRFARRWEGSSPLGLHAPAAVRAPQRACTGLRRLQRAAARMHRPLLLLLRAPGVGGGEAGEQRQPRRRQRAAEARMQPRGPQCREITGPYRARRTWGRPGGRCTGSASSGGAPGAARTGLPRARGPGRRTGAPGTSVSRRLARAGASPRFKFGCRASRPAGGRPDSSPAPAGARSLFAEPPARLSCLLLRSGRTDRRERPQLPRRLAPRPPSVVRPNQRRPRGGYQGDAAPRPAGGVAEGPPRALFAAKFKGRQGGSPTSSPKLGRGGASLERTATPGMQRAGTGRRGHNWGCRTCWYL